MSRRNLINHRIAVIFVAFIVIAVNIPGEVHAFTFRSSDFSTGEKGSVVASRTGNNLLPSASRLTEMDKSKSIPYPAERGESKISFNPGLIPGKRDSGLNLIKGEFCLIELKSSEEFSHFFNPDENDWESPPPAPVPLPGSAFLLGSGLMIIVAVWRRQILV